MTLPNITGTFRVIGAPELRHTQSGKAVASFRAVASDSKKNDSTGEWETQAEAWVNVSVWDQAAEQVIDNVNDRDLVHITGRLEVRTFDKRDGTKGQSVDVKFAQVYKALPKGQGGPQRAAADPWAGQQATAEPWAQQGSPAPF